LGKILIRWGGGGDKGIRVVHIFIFEFTSDSKRDQL